uniref:Protein PHYLLO, chloroplastic isoform X1 n=1 Tax=Tanacetum cinerariifolium TaxID=118510 RepID=A0A699SAU6_TANCI|nr:protein PHYLLO, chloroplastic isoform X1 [Tanacetum cinerariifolium]
MNLLHLQTPFHVITSPPSKITVTVTVTPSRHRFTFPPHRHRHSILNLKVVRNSVRVNEVKVMEVDEAEMLLATCITRVLSPALTLELGLERIRDAVNELKLKPKPNCSNGGMYRLQVPIVLEYVRGFNK